MKKIRLLALGLAAGTILSLGFSGCGKSSSVSGGKQAITVWVHPFITDTGVSDKMWKDFKTKFEKENSNITVDIQNIPWANRDQRMLTAFSAGKGPDVVYLIPDHLSQFGYMGIIEPLDKLVPKDTFSGFDESAINAVTINGKKYGLPMLESVMGYYYNLDLLQQAGWDANNLPKTWDDLLALCKQVKEKTGKYGYDLQGGNVANMSVYPYIWQAGGDILNSNGKDVINSDATKKAFNFLKQLYISGYTPPDSVTAQEHQALYKQGDIACMYTDSSFLQLSSNIKYKWTIGPTLKDTAQATYGTIGSWSISHTSTNKSAAVKWTEFLIADDQMKTFLINSQYIPPKKSLKDMYKDNVPMNTLTGQAQYVRVGVLHPAGRSIQPLVVAELQGVLLNKETVDQACTNLVPSIDKAIQDSLALKP